MSLFCPNLPIHDALPALLAALAERRCAVLEAPPGAGKSTIVPLALLDAPWLRGQRIVMLEPRRLAARAVAARMAALLGEPVGATVGYRTRLDSKVGAGTRIEVVTEGILTRRLQRDPDLDGTGLVIFDEFHERSLHADLGLALTLDVRDALREDLGMLVMSATLEGEAVARLLGDAPRITSSGRSWPVATHYLGRARNAPDPGRGDFDIARTAAEVTRTALGTEDGDILVFLPGQREIRRAREILEAAGLPAGVHVMPLYGDLSPAEQDAALTPAPPGQRKVVLATNIAETSLTIEGVRIVVDSGLARRSRFAPASGMNRLETLRISRAQADQRRGRAGRLGPGTCHRLWTESEHALLPAMTPPEILEADLAPLALDLAAWGVTDSGSLRWLDPPPPGSFAQARELLAGLDALDAGGRITDHGRQLAAMGTHPRLGHMLIKARDHGAVGLASRIAALLGERDVLRSRDTDLRLRLEALDPSRGGSQGRADPGARRRIVQAAELLAREARGPADSGIDRVDELTGILLANAFPDRIAQPRGETRAGTTRYLLSGGKGAYLEGAQLLQTAEFLVVAELDAGDREARIRLAAPLTSSGLETACAHLITERERVEWDPKAGAVVAARERWLAALLLDARPLREVTPDRLRAAMLDGVRALGLEALPWTPAARALRARLDFARDVDPNPPQPWPDLNDAHLTATLDDWLGPWLDGITRTEHLVRLDLQAILLAMLDWPLRQRLATLAPEHLVVPSGSRIAVDYTPEGPVLAVRLQEVFGLTETPRIGGGKVPVTLHLLSPARRPVQVTRDLAGFWARSYEEVRKEMRGRYPKHYWPDNPREAEATARAKPR